MQWAQTQKIEKGVTIIPLRDESKCDRWVLQSEAEQRIKELEAQLADREEKCQWWFHQYTNCKIRLDAVEAAYKDIRWVSSDKDNMEFTATITCWQHDRIKALEQK